MSESLHLTRNGPILEITLDRPKANAIDAKTSFAMGEAFLNFRDDPELRVAIITGGGEKFFSAGWDLKAAAEGEAPDADFGPGGFAGLTEIFDLNKPVIAAVNGYAFGGGFELALAADFIVCAENASFALPEAKLGIVPDSGGVLRLPKLLPPAIVNEMMMTGRRMSAEEALRWGIVNRVVSQSELMDSARELAQQLVNSAPLAIAALKEIYRATSEMPVEEGYRYIRSGVLKHYPSVLHSEDALEGPQAFAEKRDPVWKGRLIPVVHPEAYVHPSAVLIGDVIVGAGVYVGPHASLRGDYGRLILEAGSNLQDGCIMHGYCDTDTIVHENGHIGHGAILHGCVVGRDALIGMNSVIMDGAAIGEESIVAAMSFVKAGFQGEARQMLVGSPARVLREVTDQELHWKRLNTKEYQDLAVRCRAGLRETQPLTRVEEHRPRLKGTTDVKPKSAQ